jgi:hypothetical protein
LAFVSSLNFIEFYKEPTRRSESERADVPKKSNFIQFYKSIRFSGTATSAPKAASHDLRLRGLAVSQHMPTKKAAPGISRRRFYKSACL